MTKYVPGVGNRNTNVVFVGEAPGTKEEIAGEPFVGPEGSLFRSALEHVGVSVEDSYITNVCPIRPPANDIMRFLSRRKRKKQMTYTIKEPMLAKGIAELFFDLAEIEPNVIVPMGNVGLWALTGSWAISRYRGSQLEVSWDMDRTTCLNAHGCLSAQLIDAVSSIQGMKVIPTYHPGAVNREYKLMPLFLTDLRYAAKHSSFPEIKRKERKFIIDPPKDELQELISEMTQAPVMEFDIECVGSKLYCVGFAIDPSWSLTLTCSDPGNMEAIRILLTSPVPKVAQNGFFDHSYLMRFNGIEVNNYIYDTMVAQHVSYAEQPKGIDTLASVYTDEPYWKDEGKNWSATDAEDVQRFLEYNGKDCCVGLEIWQAMESHELTKFNRREVHDFIMKQAPAYSRMMYSGMLLDRNEVNRLRTEYEESFRTMQRQLDEAVMRHLMDVIEKAQEQNKPAIAARLTAFIKKIAPGVNTDQGALNVNSSKILKEYLYEIRGFKVKTAKNSKGKKVPTVREKALKELYMETGDPFLLTIVKIRQKRKRVGTYLNLKHDGTGRVYWSVNPVRAETGRSACSKTILQEGLNMQTVPHELRSIFVAEPGYSLAYLDYSQAEARIVAYKAGIRRMIEAFEAPVQEKYTASDVHSLTAHNVLGVPYEEMKEYPHRYLGKKCNHAFNYEMGPYLFWEEITKESEDTGVAITRSEAIKMRKAHFAAYPELQLYWRSIRSMIERGRMITNPFGRTRIFSGRKDDSTFREGYSHYAQSTVRDLLGHAIINVDAKVMESLRRDGFVHSRIVLDVHDALLIQFPTDLEHEVIPACKEAMVRPINIDGKEIIIPVDSNVGKSWGEAE